jgi:hypothetical protein
VIEIGVVIVQLTMKERRDTWWHDELSQVTSEECEPEWLGVEEPLFMLYTRYAILYTRYSILTHYTRYSILYTKCSTLTHHTKYATLPQVLYTLH